MTDTFTYGKEFAWNVEDMGLIPRLGRSPGGGHGNPLPDSCLQKNPMDRGAWWATVYGLQRVGRNYTIEHARTQFRFYMMLTC